MNTVNNESAASAPIYKFSLENPQGQTVSLADYSGKILLVVNIATRCGYTPQLTGLETTYAKYKDKGLVVLGIPSNEFGGQSPESDEEIAKFCQLNYKSSFPVFSKVEVNGANAHPLYKFLKSSVTDSSEIRWNFEKFLIDKTGTVKQRFASGDKPDSSEMQQAIEALL
ncbi:MAG: glutathione peroxidase [Spirochaetota bacterium]